MAATPTTENQPGLRRVLGTWDLVLFNIAAIVALRWLSMAAQIGPSSLLLWLLGLVGFFMPLALAVLELSSRMPDEGGLYLWSKAAFGDMHGFVAGWTYWVSNLAFFPAALLFSAGIHEAYIILIDMTAVMSLLPLLYILLAFPLLRRRGAGRNAVFTCRRSAHSVAGSPD